MLKTILLLRFLDVHSTYLVISKFGVATEGNFLPRLGMQSLGFGWYLVLNFVLSSVVLSAAHLLVKNKIADFSIKGFLAVNWVVVISNYISYFLAVTLYS